MEDVPLLSERRVIFAELVTIPKRECKANTRKKTFQTHLLSSSQNQLIIWKAEEVSKKKEEQQIKRQNAMKKVIQDEKKIKKQNKKKVTCRKDTVKARKLPVKRVRGVLNYKY